MFKMRNDINIDVAASVAQVRTVKPQLWFVTHAVFMRAEQNDTISMIMVTATVAYSIYHIFTQYIILLCTVFGSGCMNLISVWINSCVCVCVRGPVARLCVCLDFYGA